MILSDREPCFFSHAMRILMRRDGQSMWVPTVCDEIASCTELPGDELVKLRPKIGIASETSNRVSVTSMSVILVFYFHFMCSIIR
jgi:hypothetical protein